MKNQSLWAIKNRKEILFQILVSLNEMQILLYLFNCFFCFFFEYNFFFFKQVMKLIYLLYEISILWLISWWFLSKKSSSFYSHWLTSRFRDLLATAHSSIIGRWFRWWFRGRFRLFLWFYTRSLATNWFPFLIWLRFYSILINFRKPCSYFILIRCSP